MIFVTAVPEASQDLLVMPMGMLYMPKSAILLRSDVTNRVEILL